MLYFDSLNLTICIKLKELEFRKPEESNAGDRALNLAGVMPRSRVQW